MSFDETFARLLREQLRQRGWTASHLAQRLEIHRSTVNRWVNGETRPDTISTVLILADEIGLDNDARELLVRAYTGQAVERQLPAISVVELPSRQPAASALADLPAPVADFIGRDPQLALLSTAVKQSLRRDVVAMVNICGLAGIGKSELGYALARQLAHHFPDGQVWLCMDDPQPLTPTLALQSLLRAFDPSARLPDELVALKDLYHQLLQRRRVLILADDCRDAAQVVELIPPPGSALLVTSRQRFTLPGMTMLDLERLSDDDATALALLICPRLGERAGELAGLCGGLPLALRLSATALHADPTLQIPRYLEALRNQTTRLFMLQDIVGGLAGLGQRLLRSYLGLDPAAQAALVQLSVFEGSFDLAAALAVVALEQQDPAPDTLIRSPLETLLGLLYRRSMIDWDGLRERYELHPLVRSFGLLRLADEPAVRQRLARYTASLDRG